MRTTDTRILNWRRPIPKEDPAVARLLAICTALASEVTVLRERLDAHERLAVGLSPAIVDAYVPDAEAMKHRDQVRQGQIRRIFRALKDEAEREARAAAARAEKTGAPAASKTEPV
jgi:hypothetical protein